MSELKKSSKILRAVITLALTASLALSVLTGCTGSHEKPTSKYSDASLWASMENTRDEKVDTFFVTPTAVSGDYHNLTLGDPALQETYDKFVTQTLNQKGIYDDATRFFSPIYSQATMQCYLDPENNDGENARNIAYADVKDAFEYYLENFNGGNGIILAGSSQGAEMILRLIGDFFSGKKLAKQLVCVYAIGWKVTEEQVKGYEGVHFAEGEKDIHSIVSFSSEAEDVTESLIIGKDEKTLCINPLNWSVSTDPAGSELNLGCCIYSTKGYQKGEDMKGFCGAYIDGKRGALKVTGIEDPDQSLYPSRIDGQPYGVYHIYDWEFFYRNLEANVQARTAEYLASVGK